jgi:hypothetical protein
MSQASAKEGRHRRHATRALPGDAPVVAIAEGACEAISGAGPWCFLGVARRRRMGVREEATREMGGGPQNWGKISLSRPLHQLGMHTAIKQEYQDF